MFKFTFSKWHSLLACVWFLFQANVSSAQQVCPANLVASAPATRYIVLSNTGEVRDNTTGLVWQRCSLGQVWSGTTCTGTPSTYDFNQALIAANGAGTSGGYPWRLPNIHEIKSLAEWACHSPSLNVTLFPITAASYPPATTLMHWTSTSEQTVALTNSNKAWGFNFNPTPSNSLMPKSTSLVVRLVRFN